MGLAVVAYVLGMCMLAIIFRAVDDCPVLVAANREEFYDRQGTAPELWDGKPAIVAGRDPRAGGTWLGVNQHGVLVAVTNRRARAQTSELRSRGLLCRDLLACRTARQAHERSLAELSTGRYAGCNLLVIDAAGAYVVQAGELIRSCPMPPGIHVLTSHDVNDVADGRTARSLGWLNSCHCGTIDDWLHEMPRLCRDHGGPDDSPICLHAPERGTVSASIVALPERLDHARWLHAQGPPCTSPLVDCSHLFRKLFAFEGSVLDARQPAGRP